MNKNTDNTPTIEQFKKNVQTKFYNEYKKQGYKLGRVYEIEARKYGFKTWRDMHIHLKNKEEQSHEK